MTAVLSAEPGGNVIRKIGPTLKTEGWGTHKGKAHTERAQPLTLFVSGIANVAQSFAGYYARKFPLHWDSSG